ncbi:MAG: NADH-quinone oxidoreductase subunit NuoE [Bacteroidetes bacterium]|nr:NADH-quinone oxidoreductase subunit NuoE [Bacteroidota bacterium]MCL5026960.1 NADH-quinone oxidoreductase subunit NuoE [Chloroflexota bacterium]
MEVQVKGEMAQVEDILGSFPRAEQSLIPVLQQVQDKLGYLPPAALARVAEYLRLSPSQVFGVVTFYAQFRLTPRGKHMVRVCRGTACHVRGGPSIRRAVEGLLGLAPGGTTEDMQFTYETVACLGACALAPVMVVDNHVHGQMTPDKARQVLEAAKPA